MRTASRTSWASAALFLPAALGLCGLSCCATGPLRTATPAPPPQVARLLGDNAVRILSAPTRVQTFRLVSRSEGGAGVATHPAATAPADLHGWRVAAAGPDRDAAFGSRVAAAMFAADSYRFDRAKGCIFDPGVAFRVWSGDEHADLLLCFSCDEFILFLPEADGNTRRVGEDFEDNRAAFVRLAKDAFPQDPLIQSLQ